MRLILLIAILFSVKLSVFGQTVWDSKELSNAIDVVKKEPCIILFYDKFLSTDLQKQHIEQIQVLFEVPVKIIDSIFFEEKNLNLKLSLFYVLCSKHREKVTENHLEVLRSNQKITLCHGTNTESLPLNDAATFIYEITIPVKEKIRNKETLNLYHEALDLWYKDPVDYDKMISLLNKADSLEPNNPIILDARGNARFNSKLDVEGGMDDFQKAIDYSMDQKNLAIRHHNRAMIYFELGKPDLACEDWIKGGENSTFFIDEYCNRSIDTTINPNIDQKVLFTMTSKRDTIVIQPEDLDLESYMPFTCYAELTIQNKSNNAITFATGAINLGFERMD